MLIRKKRVILKKELANPNNVLAKVSGKIK